MSEENDKTAKSTKNKVLDKLVFVFGLGIGILFTLGALQFLENQHHSSDYEKYTEKIAEITADDLEIERKWVVDPANIKWDLIGAEKYEIVQEYILWDPEIRLREVNETDHILTIKSKMSLDGMTRNEIEYPLDKESYDILKKDVLGNTISKTRYQFWDEELQTVLALDIFHGDLAGLAYLEIEYANQEEADSAKLPENVLDDVTENKLYKNQKLAQFGIPEDWDRFGLEKVDSFDVEAKAGSNHI